MLIRTLDQKVLREQFSAAQPFRFVCIDGFLQPAFAMEVAAAFPSFEQADRVGHGFKAVNEYRKVQVTNYACFSEPIQRLADALKDRTFIETLEHVTGIPNIVWDDTFAGGGIHETASSGLLDVHVDFNRIGGSGLYRRLNLLLYLNPMWDDRWGGQLELWDKDVRRCHHVLSPRLNRCVIFETSDISFHGVRAVRCPAGQARKSFAVYYYTREAPPRWTGKDHTTIFKPRPEEHLKRYVLMPAEKMQQRLQTSVVGRMARRLVYPFYGPRK